MKKLHLPLFTNLIISALIVLFTFVGFLGYQASYLAKINLNQIGEQYANSQYVKGDAAQEKISDETVYLYAADAYSKGQSPTEVNFEHPPLGKYLISLSLSFFNNGSVINLFLLPLVFTLLYRLGTKTGLTEAYNIIFLLLVGSSTIYFFYASKAMLDIFQLFFSVLFLLLLINKRHFALIGITLGLLMSVKYFIPTLALYAMVSWYFMGFRKTLLVLGVALLTYLATYIMYFRTHSLVDFIKFEWFRFKWWTGDRTMPKFLILQTIFMGKFKTWWDTGYQTQPNWSPAWPALFLGSLASIPLLASREAKGIAIYCFGMLFLYLIGAAAYERYLIQILPFMTLLVLLGLKKRFN